MIMLKMMKRRKKKMNALSMTTDNIERNTSKKQLTHFVYESQIEIFKSNAKTLK